MAILRFFCPVYAYFKELEAFFAIFFLRFDGDFAFFCHFLHFSCVSGGSFWVFCGFVAFSAFFVHFLWLFCVFHALFLRGFCVFVRFFAFFCLFLRIFQ